MPSPPVVHLLVAGLRVPVRAPGLLIGRGGECDLVIDDAHVSRRHAQIWLSISGVEVIPVGRNPVIINGVPHSVARPLCGGDQISIGGQDLHVEAVPARRGEDVAPWTLARGAVGQPVNRSPFTIGGRAEDDLIVAGWSGGAARLHQVQGALFIEVEADGVWLNGQATVAGDVEPVGEGDRIAVGELTLVLQRLRDAREETTRAVVMYPTRVELRLLPRGGQLSLIYATTTRSLLISERRLELLTVLLRPPPPLHAGDFVADAVILQRVWPGSDRADRGDLNVLIHRLRRDLIKAGVNGLALIVRQVGGGETRFALHATTEVAVVGGDP